MTFDFHPDALKEYEEAGLWHEEQRFRLGIEFADAIDAAIASILAAPTRYQPVGDGVRIYRLKRFPCFLYYRFIPVQRNRSNRANRGRDAQQATTGLLARPGRGSWLHLKSTGRKADHTSNFRSKV